MKVTGRRSYMVNLESVVMTDIVLNMFIFFFISFSLLYTFSPYRMKQLDVKLPEVESAPFKKTASQVNITISNEGPVYLNGALVTRTEMKEKVLGLKQKKPDLGVILYSDKSVYFKDVVGVLDILHEVGIRNLNIAAVAEQK